MLLTGNYLQYFLKLYVVATLIAKLQFKGSKKTTHAPTGKKMSYIPQYILYFRANKTDFILLVCLSGRF